MISSLKKKGKKGNDRNIILPKILNVAGATDEVDGARFLVLAIDDVEDINYELYVPEKNVPALYDALAEVIAQFKS